MNVDSGGPDVVADHLTATTEGALSVIVFSAAWADAVNHLVEEVGTMSFRAISASPDDPRRIDGQIAAGRCTRCGAGQGPPAIEAETKKSP